MFSLFVIMFNWAHVLAYSLLFFSDIVLLASSPICSIVVTREHVLTIPIQDQLFCLLCQFLELLCSVLIYLIIFLNRQHVVKRNGCIVYMSYRFQNMKRTNLQEFQCVCLQEHARAKLVAIGSDVEQSVIANLLRNEGSK